MKGSRITQGMTSLPRVFVAAGAFVLALSPTNAFPQEAPVERSAPPQSGKAAPDFALNDWNGKRQTLFAFRGRPVALFFFCGCESCYATAREWATALPSVNTVKKGNPRPQTIITYTEMSAKSARSLARSASLSDKDAVFLLDSDAKIARDRYHAEPCPRVFVLDARGVLRYTNEHEEDAPRVASASLLVAKTVSALRAVSP
jgi:hypothetical protein